MSASSSITVQGIFACVCVTDFDEAVAWYVKLIGREPDDRPLPDMVQWRNGFGLQIWRDAQRSGQSLVTIVVPSLSAERERMAEAGLLLEQPIGGTFGLIASIKDPAGNRVTFAEPPKGMD